MDIFRSRHYSANVILLSMIGLWPYQKFKTWQLIQQIMCPISIITVMMSQAIKLFEIWGDLDIMIECLTPMGVQLGACIKFINSIANRKKMIKLLEKIKSDWSELRNEEEIEILTKYAEEGRKLTIIYTVFLYCTIFIYLVIPLMPGILDVIVPLNESRPTVYLYQTQYYVDPEEYFVWILLHTYSGTLVTVTCVIAADTMFACYLMHVCGILAVIGYAVEWYSLSTRNQHLLRFAMMRTVEPQKITAGKIYIMSMENFGVIIQSSMSYFTVFASVR